jgi:DNA-binding PadR family transcriptional regulator
VQRLTTASFVLAAMAAVGREARLTRTQIRIAVFWLDSEAPHLLDGPHFRWVPGPFGPVAPGLFNVLDRLNGRGLVRVGRLGSNDRVYRLTDRGSHVASRYLNGLGKSTALHLTQVLAWLGSMDTRTLVEDEIQSRYPDMTIQSGRADARATEP